MKKTSQVVYAILILFSNFLFAQNNREYNEVEVRKMLDKYIENPKLYYDKIKTLNERADKANENALKVSEEYLSLLDKKDSLIKIYKNKAAMASRQAAAAPAATATPAVITSSPSSPAQQTTAIMTKVQGKTTFTPYRVQLAAYFKEDFEKFFGSFNKTLGIQKLNNRNVIEVQGFKDEQEAYEFSQKIQKLGFPGAFVTKYDENGERQEGFTKTDTKFFATESKPKANPTSSAQAAKTPPRSPQYPEYIPVGYKEHMLNIAEPIATKKSIAVPAPSGVIPKAKTAEPVQLRAPVISPDAIISSTPPPSLTVPQLQKPKTIANNAPAALPGLSTPQVVYPSTPKPANNTPPPVTKSTREQLDATFDQLFKR